MAETAVTRWHPPPLIRASAALHAAGAVAILVHPAAWIWVLSLIVANHAFLCVAVLFPRASLLGPNLVRLPQAAVRRREVCLTFDDGPDAEVTPQVLDILDRFGAKASFFCIGRRAAAAPALVVEIVRRGHRVENHSQAHSFAFSLFGLRRQRRDLDAAQQILTSLAGSAPRFFRAPAGFRNVLLDPVLARLRLRYVSWTRRGGDGMSSDAARVYARLTRGLAAGDILMLHDGRQQAAGAPVVLTVLPLLLERLRAMGLESVTLYEACERAGAA